MFDQATLHDRLRKWSSSLSADWVAPPARPILLYQSIYSLMHDLKSSIQISSDPQINDLTPSVLNSDAMLRKLAHDELELDSENNQELWGLARKLADLKKLEHHLTRVISRAQVLTHGSIPILSSNYPWDGLARARATSSARHGFQFLQHSTEVGLQDLLAFDQTIQKDLTAAHGIAIIRHLEPLKDDDSAKTAKAASMLLSVTQLAGAPVDQAAILLKTKRWNPAL